MQDSGRVGESWMLVVGSGHSVSSFFKHLSHKPAFWPWKSWLRLFSSAPIPSQLPFLGQAADNGMCCVTPRVLLKGLPTTICNFLLTNHILLCCCLDGKVGEISGGSVLVFFVVPFHGTYWGNDSVFSREKDWQTSSPDVQLAFCKSTAQGNRGNSSAWVWRDCFGATLVMLSEEHFQVRDKSALPRWAFSCLAQSQETVNISALSWGC